MTSAEKLFHDIAAELPGVHESKMFGAMCIKAANGKAGVMYYNGDLVIKLAGEHYDSAMHLQDAKVFEPMIGRPMGGWVQLPELHSPKWKHYAAIAMEEVAKIEVVKKGKK